MKLKSWSNMALAWLVVSGVSVGATSALAQPSGTPGLSGCPDGDRDGVVAMNPLGGGGCEGTVYATGHPTGKDPLAPSSGMRGAKPSKSMPSTSPVSLARKRTDAKDKKPAVKLMRKSDKPHVQKN